MQQRGWNKTGFYGFWSIGLLLLVAAACQSTLPTQEGSLNERTDSLPPAELRAARQRAANLPAVLAEYDAFVRHWMDSLQLPGVAYAIVKDGRIIAQHSYGVRQVGGTAPIDEHTVFRMASVSKGFAAVLAGQLVEANHFHWDDTLRHHLPYFKLKKNHHTNSITLRHTLSHTTGLKEYGGVSLIYEDYSCAKILRSLSGVPIAAMPNDTFTYQNAIYSAIAEVAKTTTGYSYERLLDSLLFRPLGMADASTGYRPMATRENKGMPHTYSQRYGWRPNNIRNKWYNVAPAAGVNASLSDMTIWLQAMMGYRPDVVSPSVLNEIFRPHIPINNDSKYYETWGSGLRQGWYGMGWRLFDYYQHRIVYHGGFLRGFRPEMAFCPREGIGLVVLTNASRNDFSTLCIPAFFERYFASPESSRPPLTQPPAQNMGQE